MRAILEDIEIDTSRDDRAVVRERKKAISTQIIRRLSERLAEAYAKAGPDDEVVVVSLRKQMQHGVFNRKYMTSFVTYVEDGELYVFLSRVEFKLAEDGRAKLPADPRVGDDVMRFRTVGNANYTTVGARGVKVDWRSPAFGTDLDPPAESGRRRVSRRTGSDGAETRGRAASRPLRPLPAQSAHASTRPSPTSRTPERAAIMRRGRYQKQRRRRLRVSPIPLESRAPRPVRARAAVRAVPRVVHGCLKGAIPFSPLCPARTFRISTAPSVRVSGSSIGGCAALTPSPSPRGSDALPYRPGDPVR